MGAAAGLLLHLCSADGMCGKGRNRSPQCANLCKVHYWTPEGGTSSFVAVTNWPAQGFRQPALSKVQTALACFGLPIPRSQACTFVGSTGCATTRRRLGACCCSNTSMAVAANQPEAATDPSNAIYVNQGDDEPVQMESLCMNCHENASCYYLQYSCTHLSLRLPVSVEAR